MVDIIGRMRGYFKGDSILSEESDEMLHEHHVEVQRGLKQFGKVNAKDPNIHENPENTMEEGLKAHPLLDLQHLDGVDLNLSPIALENLDPEVRREVENKLRLQHQKKMENQLGATNVFSPKPQGM